MSRWALFSILMKNQIRLEFRRNWHAREGRKGLSPMGRSLIFYALMGINLAVVLAAQATLFWYSLLVVSYVMTMTAFAVILEFHHTLFDREEGDILGFRPVSYRMILTAKIVSLLVYILLISSVMGLVPSVAYALQPGIGWAAGLVLFVILLLAGCATAALMVLMFVFLFRQLNQKRLKDTLSFIQIIMAVLLFVGYQLIPRFGGGQWALPPQQMAEWIKGLPPSWFAGLILFLSGRTAAPAGALSLLAALSTLGVLGLAWHVLHRVYQGIWTRPESVSRKKKAPVKGRIIKSRQRARFLTGEMAAGFGLSRKLLWHDRSVRMGLMPLLAIPLAFMGLQALDGGLNDPFITGIFRGSGGSSFAIVWVSISLGWSFVTGLNASSDWQAAWIFRVAPLNSPVRFFWGIRLGVLVWVILPYFILLGLAYSMFISPWNAFRHAVFLFLYSLVINAMAGWTMRDFPFSQEAQRGQRTGRLLDLLIITPFLLGALGVIGGVYPISGGWEMAVVTLILLFFGLEALGKGVVERRWKRRKF